MESPGPPSAALEEHLVACAQQSLGLYLHDNACFLAERLVAQFPSEVRAAAASCLGLNRRRRQRLMSVAPPNPLPRRPTCSCWPRATTGPTSRTAHTTCSRGSVASRAATCTRCVLCSWAS